MDHYASSILRITNRLIEERFSLDIDSTTRHLNVVGDIVNLVPIYWITEEIVGFLSLYCLQVIDDSCEGGSISQDSDKS